MYKNLFLILLLLISLSLLGQKKRKYALGVNINSRSTFIGGIDFKIKNIEKSKRLIPFLLFEFANVKHLNELRVATGFNNINNNFGNKSFILGKSNTLYALRSQIGTSKLLFKGADKNGVKIGLNVAGGMSLGLIKPYYIIYQYKNPDELKKEAYNSNVHTDYNNILGSAGFFYGWKKIKIVQGVNARVSMDAEFGKSKYPKMIEAGFLFEAYSKRIQLIEGASEDWFFSSVFVVLYVGKRN